MYGIMDRWYCVTGVLLLCLGVVHGTYLGARPHGTRTAMTPSEIKQPERAPLRAEARSVGGCNFDKILRHSWWYGYDSQIALLEKYSATAVTQVTSAGVILRNFSCYGHFDSPPGRYYLRHPVGKTDPKTCVEIFYETTIGTVMAKRTLDITQANYDVSLCPTQMRNGKDLPAWIMVKSPFEFSSVKCPSDLYPGIYQVIYTQTGFGEKNCVGDINSEAFIDTKGITLKTCYKGTTNYQNPHNTRLQCVANFSPVAIDQDRFSGQILILAYTNPTNGLIAFYCSRFTAEFLTPKPGEGQRVRIHLSIGAKTEDETKCETSKNYDSASDSATDTKYRAFLMERHECRKGLCLNGANCTQAYDNYKCSCKEGTTGVNCETDIDECGSKPCQNGGTCVDHVNYYTCTCVRGYNGTNCENVISPCRSNPCRNNGTCTDSPDKQKYTCSCKTGHTGTSCESSAATANLTSGSVIDATAIAVISGGAAVALLLLVIMIYQCVKRNSDVFRPPPKQENHYESVRPAQNR